jgi:hypothetical protein
LDVGVVTSLGSERVAENFVESSILGKQTVSCAIIVLVPEKVEWCQLIFYYGPISDDLSPMKVIGSQSKDSRKLRDTKTEYVDFNAEVDGGLIPIATSPSARTELSDQFCVLV